MDEDLAPRDRRRERVHLPQMDRCRTPVFPEARVRKAERDREAQKPSPFGPRNDCELPRRHLRSSEIEHPRDPAVTKGMDLIRIGHVALRGIYLGPYSTPDIPGKRATLFNLLPGDMTDARGGIRRSRHPRSGTALDRLSTGRPRAWGSAPETQIARTEVTRGSVGELARRVASHLWAGFTRFPLRGLVHDHPDKRNHLSVPRGPARHDRVVQVVEGVVRRSEAAAAVRVGSDPGELPVRVVRGTRHARDEDAHEEGGGAPDIGGARGEWCLGVRQHHVRGATGVLVEGVDVEDRDRTLTEHPAGKPVRAYWK